MPLSFTLANKTIKKNQLGGNMSYSIWLRTPNNRHMRSLISIILSYQWKEKSVGQLDQEAWMNNRLTDFKCSTWSAFRRFSVAKPTAALEPLLSADSFRLWPQSPPLQPTEHKQLTVIREERHFNSHQSDRKHLWLCEESKPSLAEEYFYQCTEEARISGVHNLKLLMF